MVCHSKWQTTINDITLTLHFRKTETVVLQIISKNEVARWSENWIMGFDFDML